MEAFVSANSTSSIGIDLALWNVDVGFRVTPPTSSEIASGQQSKDLSDYCTSFSGISDGCRRSISSEISTVGAVMNTLSISVVSRTCEVAVM